MKVKEDKVVIFLFVAKKKLFSFDIYSTVLQNNQKLRR